MNMKQIKEMKTVCQSSAFEFDRAVMGYLNLGYSIYGQPFSTGKSYNLMMVLLEESEESQILNERVQ